MPFKVIVFLCSLFLAFAGKGFAQSSNFQPFLGDTLTRWEGVLSFFQPYIPHPYAPPTTLKKGWSVFGHFELEARPWGIVDSIMLHAVRFRLPGKANWESFGLFLYEDSNHHFLVQTYIYQSSLGGGSIDFGNNAFMDSSEKAMAIQFINDGIFYSGPGYHTPRVFLKHLGSKPESGDSPELTIHYFEGSKVLGNNLTPAGGVLEGVLIDSISSQNNQRVAYTSSRKSEFGNFVDSIYYPMLLNPGPDANELYQYIEGAGNNFVLGPEIRSFNVSFDNPYGPPIINYEAYLHLSSLSCYWRDGNLISTHGLYPVYGCGSPLDSAWQFTGMQQAQEATGALLYPNPSQGMVRIEAKELHQEASFYFVSMSGKVVYAIQGIDPQHLNTQSLSKGLYEVFFKNPDGQAYRVGRLVVP